MKCPRCGADITGSTRFCLQCGDNISYVKTVHEQSASQQSPDSQPVRSHQELAQLNDQLDTLIANRPVTDTAVITAIRQCLTSWADRIPDHGINDFGSAIALGSVTERISYVMRLTSAYETRGDLNECRRPYKEEPIPATPLLKQKISNVWDIEVPHREQQTIENEEFVVTESFRKQRCLDCRGSKQIICETCRNNKTIECPTCQGLKTIRCDACRGTGKIQCWTCSGKGTVKLPDSDKDQPCFDCLGKGFQTCSKCAGGSNPCATCKGAGMLKCTKCDGTGYCQCSSCQGSGEILLYISFPIQRFTRIINELVLNEHIPKNFPTNTITERRSTGRMVDITVDRFPNTSFMDEIKHTDIKEAIKALVAGSNKPINDNPSRKIVKQHLQVNAYAIYDCAYEYQGNSYRIFVHADCKGVYAQKSPIDDVKKHLIEQAQNALSSHDYSQAQKILFTVLSIDRKNAEAPSLIGRLQKQQFHRMCWNGFLGGTAAGILVLGFVVFMRRNSLNLILPCVFTGLISIGVGFLIGFSIGYLTRGNQHKPSVFVRKRIPFITGLSVVLSFFILVIFGFRYDPIRAGDRKQFLQEFNQALPFGIPAVAWDEDIQKLTYLIKKFKPTGIDISRAEEGLKKLKALKRKKIKQDTLQAQSDQARKKRWQRSWRSRQAKQRNQDKFDHEMERYENLVLQKKLTSKKQKLVYLNNT
ncbi:MAG: hypothetical protein GF384_04225, partial [Elusimicrobia bacterium]|nr:hypothetical protein [Elusimicrobiota bacterium]MBD3412076.1 hypothetical protein [Elusimicrobiota bacterium]